MILIILEPLPIVSEKVLTPSNLRLVRTTQKQVPLMTSQSAVTRTSPKDESRLEPISNNEEYEPMIKETDENLVSMLAQDEAELQNEGK